MTHAVPSDISFVDRNNDGKTDKIYFGDMGGNVWRINMDDANTANWTATKLAALGCNSGVCSSGSPRKFFFPPSVISVGATGGGSSYDMVLIGSGDREHPLRSSLSYNVINRFYMLKDTDTAVGSAGTSGITEASLFNATSVNYDKSRSGYYITLATGEKSVNAPVTVFGTTYFGTNTPIVPSRTSCSSNLGLAKGYALNPFTGAYSSNVYDGGGLPPSAVAGLVNIDKPGGGTELKPFCIGCGGRPDCDSALENCGVRNPVAKRPRRSYWYKK
jgi:type IV pilus assembly protein PilY1